MGALIQGGAWNPAKVAAFRGAFETFLKHVRIQSKETGGWSRITPYGAQTRFLDAVFGGLEQDKHNVAVLKSRQLGISTISWLLDLFWIGVLPGLQGAVVFDNMPNKEKFRSLLANMIQSLPAEVGYPKVVRDFREGLVLDNGSMLDYLVAGTRKTNASGALGASRALNFIHATEICSWGDQEGVESLKASLSTGFKDRLYIWESTARGFGNVWYDIWEDAKADDLTWTACFIGWWAKETQRYERDNPLFARYGSLPPNDEEAEKIDQVMTRYGHRVTAEQLAWYRHYSDPSGKGDDANERSGGSEYVGQAQPWVEEDAFILSGSQFFSNEMLSSAAQAASRSRPKGYRFMTTNEFFDTAIWPANSAKSTQLRVWEEPDPAGVYALGADPAGGSNEDSDNYVAQVIRCYADEVEQVAEFCARDIKTYQFAWIITALAGAYGNCRLLLEINSVGEGVRNEFLNIRRNINSGLMRTQAREKGWLSALANIREYMYKRHDSLAGGPTAWQWRTTSNNKPALLDRYRDYFERGKITIHSLDALEEMKKIVKKGDSIKGEGHTKDDRVISLALAVRAWEDGEQKALQSQGRTREIEEKRRQPSFDEMYEMFGQSVFQGTLDRNNAAIRRQNMMASRANWRNR